MADRSIDVPALDDPHLIQPDELVASHNLAALCFPGFVQEIKDQDLIASYIASYTPPRRGGAQVICHRGVPVSQINITQPG